VCVRILLVRPLEDLLLREEDTNESLALEYNVVLMHALVNHGGGSKSEGF